LSAYASAFDHYGINVAQILLTLDDSKDRKRYLNGCATLQALIERRVIPIVNENDTVATDEICYGDNDRLAARIALMTKADALILLSDVDGLYTADPYKNPKAEHIALVDDVNQDIILMAGAGVSKFSKGGMITKLLAARTVTRSGCTMAIAQGKTMNSLQGFGKDKLCTWFLPKTNPHDARKKWIAGMKFLGTVLIDQGAAEALKNGRSLLPVGVVNVEGDFQKGDPVTIADCHQNIVGAALTRHSSEAIKKLIGCKSSEIPERLGYPGCAVVAHRDDLVLWSG
jgi:glutamate 5-kinase